MWRLVLNRRRAQFGPQDQLLHCLLSANTSGKLPILLASRPGEGKESTSLMPATENYVKRIVAYDHAALPAAG